jgi:hypothetical protein
MKVKKIFILSLLCILTASTFADSVSARRHRKRGPVHGEILKRVNVPIVYGLAIDIDQPDARRELFPYANRIQFGGCEWDESYPKEAAEYYCYECRVAQYEYEKELVERAHKIGKLPESGWWRTAQSNKRLDRTRR